jgi:hypothetical protein
MTASIVFLAHIAAKVVLGHITATVFLTHIVPLVVLAHIVATAFSAQICYCLSLHDSHDGHGRLCLLRARNPRRSHERKAADTDFM